MRYVQAGILACLVAITGLLFAIWQNERSSEAPQTVEEALVQPPEAIAEEVAPEPPAEAEPIQVAPPARPVSLRTEPKPSPRRAPAPPPAERSSPPKGEPPSAAAPPAAPEPDPGPDPEPDLARVEPPPARTPDPDRILRPSEEPQAPPEPRTVTLPAGLRIAMRLNQTLSTARNRAGDAFSGTLSEPLVADGLVIADKGARVEGRVVEAERAGRVSGLAELAYELTAIHTDDGQQIAITTESQRTEGPKTRGKDLKKVGWGAGIGAVIGAIAGGGKGAAVGAGAGAGAGAATAAATRGEPAVLPAESLLVFTLAQPVSVTERL